MSGSKEPNNITSILTDNDVESIAIKVAEKITDNVADKVLEGVEARFFQRVGQTFIDNIIKGIGILLVGIFLYLESKGWLKLG